MAEWQVEPLGRGHVREGFECGVSSLNDFLRVLAGQYEKRKLGRTYVVVGEDQRVLGYYTLASSEVDAGALPLRLAKKLPRHRIPVVLLGRLAVDRAMHGQGLGAFLLRDALARALSISQQLGNYAVIVDAVDGEAKAFYEKFGFLPLTDQGLRLFLPMATIVSAAGPP